MIATFSLIAKAGVFSALFVALASSAANSALAAQPRPFQVKLPFPPGAQYEVTQGNHGHFSHVCDEFAYAWDFDMPEGSPVCAAAAGKVVEIKQDGKVGGGSRMFAGSTNYVMLDHGGGHFSRYMHLKFDAVKVSLGDVVHTGQVIALSGSTGFATSAHLHFQVCDYRGDSQPACFVDFPLRAGVPHTGDDCLSGPPTPLSAGLERFQVDSPLPADAFERNGIALNSDLPSRVYKEGETYRVKGHTSLPASEIILFVMPRETFETVERFTGPVDTDGNFDFPVKFSLAQELAESAVRMTMVVAAPDGSFQSDVNTPMYIQPRSVAALQPGKR